MMEESATACVVGDFAQALEKAKEAVSGAFRLVLSSLFESYKRSDNNIGWVRSEVGL